MSKKTFKPGQIVPKSAQAGLVSPTGKPKPIERTVVKGERFPPTPKPGMKYVIKDPTKTK